MGLLIKQIIEGGRQRQKVRNRKRVRISEEELTEIEDNGRSSNLRRPDQLRRSNARRWNHPHRIGLQERVVGMEPSNDGDAHSSERGDTPDPSRFQRVASNDNEFRHNLQTLEREADSIRRNLGDNIRVNFSNYLTGFGSGDDHDDDNVEEDDLTNQVLETEERQRALGAIGFTDATAGQSNESVDNLNRRRRRRSDNSISISGSPLGQSTSASRDQDLRDEEYTNPRDNPSSSTSWTRNVRRRVLSLQPETSDEREALFTDNNNHDDQDEDGFETEPELTYSLIREGDEEEQAPENGRDNRSRNRHSIVIGEDGREALIWTVYERSGTVRRP